ncbi:MAG TPA: hypothetical protein VIO14_08335 [Dehalococcoidia bacterium]
MAAGPPGSLRSLVALLAALALAAAASCGGGGTLPVDDPEATLERLEEARLRTWDLPGPFTLTQQGPSRNEDAAARSPEPNRRRDEFARWGRVVGYSQEFLASDRFLAVRFLTVAFKTEDGAASSLAAAASAFDSAQVPVVRSEVSLASPLGDEARAWRLTYDPEGNPAEGHYIVWRRGRLVLSAQTVAEQGAAGQADAEELAAALDRKVTESGIR